MRLYIENLEGGVQKCVAGDLFNLRKSRNKGYEMNDKQCTKIT